MCKWLAIFSIVPSLNVKALVSKPLVFRNLGLVTHCPMLALVFHENIILIVVALLRDT